MIQKGLRYLRSLRGFAHINLALSRGNASHSARSAITADTQSWEFSGFSQNGEDGIIEVLLDHLRAPDRYFIEIGSSDGLENNTSWLSLVRRYSGLWIEADTVLSARAAELFGPLNHGVRIICNAVTPDNVDMLPGMTAGSRPDVLSIDIDSYDYFVASALLGAGIRPRIFVAEYNSAFGPHAALAVAPGENPARRNTAERLHYGCSVSALRKLLQTAGYQFLTVDRNGVNAFFVDLAEFDDEFLQAVRGLDFAENFAQLRDFPGGWPEQWELIRNAHHVEVAAAPPTAG